MRASINIRRLSQEERRFLHAALRESKTLDWRRRSILIRWCEGLSLRAIADGLGVSRSRVGQLRTTALRKLLEEQYKENWPARLERIARRKSRPVRVSASGGSFGSPPESFFRAGHSRYGRLISHYVKAAMPHEVRFLRWASNAVPLSRNIKILLNWAGVGEPALSLTEIARKYNVTPSTIRTWRGAALHVLWASNRSSDWPIRLKWLLVTTGLRGWRPRHCTTLEEALLQMAERSAALPRAGHNKE